MSTSSLLSIQSTQTACNPKCWGTLQPLMGSQKIFKRLLQSHQVNALLGLSSKTPQFPKFRHVCVPLPTGSALATDGKWRSPWGKVPFLSQPSPPLPCRGFKTGPYLINAHQHPLYAMEAYWCLEFHSVWIAGLINRGDLGLWKVSVSDYPDTLQIPED